LCRECCLTFSRATFHPCFDQKKRQINVPLWHHLDSKVSERQLARLLEIDRKTVARKLRFLGLQARIVLRQMRADLKAQGLRTSIQFDEMETFEHTKCKPLSVPLVVDGKTRLILGIDVCQMPAHGRLAEISRRKYGPRPSHRIPTLRRVLRTVRPVIDPGAVFKSDMHPYYPPMIRDYFPQAQHRRYKGRLPTETGQGELKQGGWDPLFSVNHTAGMIRDHVSRFVRKTWGTTKKRARLKNHLMLYAVWHNKMILSRRG
jgi:hypothetical protein